MRDIIVERGVRTPGDYHFSAGAICDVTGHSFTPELNSSDPLFVNAPKAKRGAAAGKILYRRRWSRGQINSNEPPATSTLPPFECPPPLTTSDSLVGNADLATRLIHQIAIHGSASAYDAGVVIVGGSEHDARPLTEVHRRRGLYVEAVASSRRRWPFQPQRGTADTAAAQRE